MTEGFLRLGLEYRVATSHHVLQTACALVQTACSSLSVLFAACTHDILCKVGFGIVLLEALTASGLDPDWGQNAATSDEFQVFGGVF
jgi:hypothetical protein